MPIATVQLPNGKIADIEVPQGATPQDIESFVMSQPEFSSQPKIEQKPQESFQEANRRRVGQFAMGLPNAFGNALIGGVQAGADLGDKAVRMIDQIYFGDSLSGQKLFGERLAEQVKKRKEEQAQLPAAERAGIKIGELIPYATMGASTGAKVAAATGSKIAGLIAGGAVGGGEMTALSPQEEAGLGNRAVETAKGAATGGAFGAGLGIGGKVVGGLVKGTKGLFTAKTAEDVLAARLPKEQTAQLLEQLKTATPENPVLLPDIAGDAVKGLTRSVAKIPVARDIVTDALENRSKAAVSRVSDYLAKDISPVDNYFGNLDDLVKARSEVSKPLYDKVFRKDKTKNNFTGLNTQTATLEVDGVKRPIFNSENEPISDTEEGLKEFWRFFGNSEVTDNYGRPKVVYHGTDKVFDKFDKSKSDGFWFTDNVDAIKNNEVGASNQGKIMKAYLKSENLLENGSNYNVDSILEEGYDGIKNMYEYGTDYAAVHPEQIRLIITDTINTGATLPIKNNEELFAKIAPELKTVRNDFRLTPEEAPDNSFTLLHHVKESLYDKAQVAKRQGANSQARVYDNLRTELTRKMGEASPDYKKANEVFGGFSQLKSAQENGLEFSKLRPEEIRREMLGMNAGERDAYRIGVKEDLQKIVSSTADGADPAKRIFGNEFKREQLRAVFGNETKFKEFEEKLATEIKAADTKAKVLGGSRSDYNMAGDDEFLNRIVQGGFTVAKSKVNPLYIAEATYNAISNKFAGINKGNAKEIAQSLVDRGQTIKTLENIIKREKNPIQKRIALEAKDFIAANILTKTATQ